jgi:ssDNA-binding replication factor A large subunit
MLIKDLKPKTNVDKIELEIVSMGEPKSFINKNGSGTLCNAAAKDEAGDEISITFWNEQYKGIENGTKLKIINGWVNEYNGNLQISTGREGKIEIE